MSSSAFTLSLAVKSLSFEYTSASQPLFTDLEFEVSSGWSGFCGANGSGKSTLLRLLSHELSPASGRIYGPERRILCEQRTDFIPEKAHDFIEDYSAESYKIRVNLGIDDEWIERWETLSHGERKRLQIGTALWQEPDLLLIDEPTNHLDVDSKQQMIRSLKQFRGIGIIVTHDRQLLDDLCDQCLWFGLGGQPQLIPGGYTSGTTTIAERRESQRRQLEQLESENKRLMSTAHHYRKEACQSDRKRSNRGIDPRDNDARGKRNLARVSGKDAIDGKRLRQMEGRIRQLQDRKSELSIEKTFDTGIWMDFEATHRNLVFESEERILRLGPNCELLLPKLELRPKRKIWLRGPNGAGKSSLLREIVGKHKLASHELLYLAQEIKAQDAAETLMEIKKLPNAELGQLMNIIRRLGSDPKSLLESENPSPGEIRKLLLAVGIVRRPSFLVMDEPTNHLDLPSIECLQHALEDCPFGYLMVTHDTAFGQALGADEWMIDAEGEDRYRLNV